MMRSLCFRVWPYVAASLFLSTAVVVPASGDTIDLRPVADTFVVNPPSNPPSPNLNGRRTLTLAGLVLAQWRHRPRSVERAGRVGHTVCFAVCCGSTHLQWPAIRSPVGHCSSSLPRP